MRILVIEDDALLARGIELGLRQQGHAVDVAPDARSGRATALAASYDALVLDLGLPDQDGLEVLATLRREGYRTPVLILTARDEISDRVSGLDAGADDYLVKPFDLDELAARLRAISRRPSGQADSAIRLGSLVIDLGSRSVSMGGSPVDLSRRELALLIRLAEHPGRVLTRQQLEEGLYGWNEPVESNAIEVHVHRLRRKLGSSLIRTVRGVGYALERPAGAEEGERGEGAEPGEGSP